jgi:hypothetical protein
MGIYQLLGGISFLHVRNGKWRKPAPPKFWVNTCLRMVKGRHAVA